MFPRPYDAGELQMLAQKIVYFFGRKGYPFAELTVGVSPVHDDSGAHASHIPFVTITYDVRVNGFYVWGEPFIAGQIQTSPNLIKQDILIKKGDIFDVAAIAASKKRLQTRQYIASVETGQAGIERDVKPCADTVTGFPDTSCAGSVRVPFVITDKTGLGFDGAGEHGNQILVALLDQFAPRFGDGGAGLGATVAAAVFFAGGFEGFAGFDPRTG